MGCKWDPGGKDIDWGYYSKDTGNCSNCTKLCEKNETCEAVECGEDYCSWWKNGQCNEYYKLTSANKGDLHTCMKLGNANGKI